MNKQDVYIPVSVKDELPKTDGVYNVMTAHSNWITQREFVGVFTNYDGYKVTHWLKPFKQVYVLTEDELKKFATDFFIIGGITKATIPNRAMTIS